MEFVEYFFSNYLSHLKNQVGESFGTIILKVGVKTAFTECCDIMYMGNITELHYNVIYTI